MFELHNVRMEPSNLRKKIRKSPNVTKKLSHVMFALHNIRMKPSNVRKNKGTTKCDKRIVTCDVGITKCKDETIKCEDLITWYSRLPTNRYRTSKKKRGYRRI